MLEIFNTNSEKKIADVRSAANKDAPWKTKARLVKKCVAAFKAGHPEKLRAFIHGYLELKIAGGWVERAQSSGLDDGFVNILCGPITELLQASYNCSGELASIMQGMPPYYKQILLDVILRHACLNDQWLTALSVIAAGADVNTGQGRPLADATCKQHLKIVALLLHAGADINKARANVDSRLREAFDAAIAACETLQITPTVKDTDETMRGEEDMTQEEAAIDRVNHAQFEGLLDAIHSHDVAAFDNTLPTLNDLDVYQGKLLQTCVELNNYFMAKKLMLRGADVLSVEHVIQASLNAVSKAYGMNGSIHYRATSEKTRTQFQELTTQKERLQIWKKEVMDYAVHIARLQDITDLRAEVAALRTIVNDMPHARTLTVLPKKNPSTPQQ